MPKRKTKAIPEKTDTSLVIASHPSHVLAPQSIPFSAVVAFFAGLTLLMFADVLFTSKDTVLSLIGTDVCSQFVYWRDFGFTQLRHGNLALWNPHIYSGAPYFGGFQSALLYPLNFVYLILPLAKAINWGIALHVFLAGLFMYLWTASRGLHPLACLFSGALFMFGGAYFLHIFAGHLPNLCTMIWAPLLFLCIDGICRNGAWKWCLGGMAVVAMSILAGHPQYFFYTFVAAAIYSAFSLFRNDHWKTAAVQIAAIYAGAVALSAVQLFAGLDAGGESVRTGGLSYEAAKIFSFPWLNLATLFTPKFFGDDLATPYWGDWYFWEMSAFIGITGLFLAGYALFHGDKKLRRFSGIMAVILLALALGSHTPLYRLVYSCAPGFNRFRGISKFIFLVSLFLTMLAAVGLDHLLRKGSVKRKTAILLIGLAIGAVALGVALRFVVSSNPMGFWRNTMRAIQTHDENYRRIESFPDARAFLNAGITASWSIIWAGVTTAALGVLLLLSTHSKKWLYLVALIGIVEVFVFARTTRPTFDLNRTQFSEMAKYVAKAPPDARFFYEDNPDVAMSIGGSNLWGYDPLILRRYAEFIFFTQGENPDDASPYPHFTRYDPLYAMLRCRFVFMKDGNVMRAHEVENAMPRLQLVSDYKVVTGRDRIFAAMRDVSFDPREQVILESEPNHVPVKSKETGSAKVIESSTDWCTIEANVAQPAILLMTDPYAKGWRVRALNGSTQHQYDLLPANYVLRAIPLTAGHHHFRVEYRPKAYEIGKWVSMVSLIVYLFIAGWYWLGSREKPKFRSLAAK